MDEKNKNFWQKILKQIKRVPWYGWVAGLAMVLLQWGFYEISLAILKAWAIGPTGNPGEFQPISNMCIEPYILGIDDKIPLVPYFFSEVYYYSFVFWFFAPVVVSVTDKEHFLDYIIGLTIALAIGCVIHASLPTYIDRRHVAGQNVDVIEQVKNMKFKGLSWFLMDFMYNHNGGQFSWRAFPSYHCLLSTYAYLGIRRQAKVSRGSKIYCLITIGCIFASTLFTRQHYIIDMFASILLTVLVDLVVRYFGPGKAMVKRWPNILNINFKKKKTQKSFDK